MRTLIKASVVAALLALATGAQAADQAFFRLGPGAAAVTVETPPVNPNDDGDDDGDTAGFSYAPLSVGFGEVANATPILAPGVTGYAYSWYDNPPEHATLDEHTGVVTWDTTMFAGTVTANVYAVTEVDGEGSSVSGMVGTSKVTVTGAYAIAATPDDFSVQWGTTGVHQTFTASTVPAQSSDGEGWGIEYAHYDENSSWRGYDEYLVLAGNVAVYDSDVAYASTSDTHPFPPELSFAHERFRFTRTVEGVTTYGDWIDFNVTMHPYFVHPSDGPGYRAFACANDPSIECIQVLAGTPVNIPATAMLNADHTAEAIPDALAAFIEPSNAELPSGLTLNVDGSISGNATGGPPAWRYDLVRTAVVDSSGTIFGQNGTYIAVVDYFRDTADEFWQIPSTDNGGPLPLDPSNAEIALGSSTIDGGQTQLHLVASTVPLVWNDELHPDDPFETGDGDIKSHQWSGAIDLKATMDSLPEGANGFSFTLSVVDDGAAGLVASADVYADGARLDGCDAYDDEYDGNWSYSFLMNVLVEKTFDEHYVSITCEHVGE